MVGDLVNNHIDLIHNSLFRFGFDNKDDYRNLMLSIPTGIIKKVGADETVNYTKSSLKEVVKELTNGKGVDVVYDPVGGELTDAALRATAWHGRYLIIGFASGDIPKFAANILLLKEASAVGVWWGTWAAKNPHKHILQE